MQAREAQLVEANAATLDWIWQLKSGPTSFGFWLKTGTGIFWIQGKPGSGKSTLMNFLKNHPQPKRYFKRAYCHELVTIRFFFDCRARNGVSNSFEGLLRAFLFQLTFDIPELSVFIAEFGKSEEWQPEAQQALLWTTNTLRKALLGALETCKTNILMLIDGVDELEGSGRNMLDMIEFFKEVAGISNEWCCIKVCIASRPLPLLATAFSSFSGLKLQDHNEKGIETYIKCRLKIAAQGLYELDSGSFLATFTEDIKNRSNGIFLWAKFAIDEILVGWAENDDQKELWARLRALPNELEEIYSRIVKRVTSNYASLEETTIMLQIAYFTRRSLRPREFFTIIQLSLGRPLKDTQYSSQGFENRLRAKTGGLVEVTSTGDATNSTVRLIHETVRSFLNHQNGWIDISGLQIKEITSVTRGLSSPVFGLDLVGGVPRKARTGLATPITQRMGAFYRCRRERTRVRTFIRSRFTD